MDLGLTNKVALVTAASQGLGAASALALAQQGCKVILSSRTEEIHQTAEKIRKETKNQNIQSFLCDVTNELQIQSLVTKIMDLYGKIDILILNSGGPPKGNWEDVTSKNFEESFQLVFMPVVRFCKAVVPIMKKQKSGSIVAIQSGSVKQPISGLILSNSIRMATIGLLKSLSNELGPYNIRINSINPGTHYTARVTVGVEQRAKTTGKSIKEIENEMCVEIPLRRFNTAENFGQNVAWLASDVAGYIHGQAIVVDGGRVQSTL